MSTSIGRIAWDCIVDLGITVVYATIVGLLIVGVVATDDGPGSILTSALYASLLPISVALLIGCDLVLRVAAERRRGARFAVRVPRSSMQPSRS